MKHFILLFFTISLISGCNFLSGDNSQLPEEDQLTSEEDGLNDLIIEEEVETDEEFEEEMEEEFEEEFEEEAEEETTKDKGFFSWLFGGSDEEESNENLDSEFIGEDEDFSSAERDYEDYEEDTAESAEDYGITESIADQEDIPKQEPAQTEMTQAETPVIEETNTEETKAVEKQTIPLNKIIAVPYKKAGQIINAVYIARPDEDISSISQKIYSRNEVDQLLKINTHLQNRSVVVGDKIYYNSPNRPNDNSRLLFYYQDNNISPSYYNLSPGDNIRTVASQLLGHPKSWKEIWATNPNLQSKSKVSASLSIIYWPQSVMQAVYNSPTPPPAPETQAGQPETLNELAQAPEPVMPNEKLNNPQKLEKEELNQPISKESKGIVKELLNNVDIIVGIIVFLILLYLIIHIIMKKRKQRDFDYTATNIEM